MERDCVVYQSTKKGGKDNYGSVLQFEKEIFHAAGKYKTTTGENYYWRCSVKKPLRCKRRLVTQQKANGSHKIVQISGIHCHDSNGIDDKHVKYISSSTDSVVKDENNTEEEFIEEEETDTEEEESCEETDAQPLFDSKKNQEKHTEYTHSNCPFFNKYHVPEKEKIDWPWVFSKY